ncbi:MAG: glycosyltransferase [Candidatus Paceibacterota bacterium]|jgi:glycosyltransferase involved in cell wall biosynthesis
MKKTNNLVSIILPVYNGGKYIRRAIESVTAQTFSHWELLIIDDGSNDNTEDISREYINKDNRIHFLKNEVNLGIQKTLNKGLREAKGEYIARIDDDDEWVDKDKLQKQVEFLNENPDHVLVGTGVIVIDENGLELFRYLLPENDGDIRKKILGKNCFVHSSVMFRKNLALIFGGYSEDAAVKHIEDYDLWLKMGTAGKLANLPIYAVKFTLRGGSISSVNKIEQFKKNINLAKKYKNKYPNYFGALIRAYARIIVYGFILKSPIKFSLNKLTKFYKENW